ncbi:hypothetical protein ACT691_18615 [Vibrio metschnikovii]
MRFERTALYAHENGFDTFTSCLGSRVGKICSKLMTVVNALQHVTQA